MPLAGAHAPGATPLSDQDVEGLLIHSVTTHAELNEVEAANIIHGQEWALRSRVARLPGMLSDQFIQRLHAEMFGDVWAWAGQYRSSNTNIGVEHHLIRQELRRFYGDALSWLEHHTYAPDEFAVRLHYRVVTVHPFANGNGRHARMLAHIAMVRHFKTDPLPWGGGDLHHIGVARHTYIDALNAADHHDFGPLLAFARSTSR